MIKLIQLQEESLMATSNGFSRILNSLKVLVMIMLLLNLYISFKVVEILLESILKI